MRKYQEANMFGSSKKYVVVATGEKADLTSHEVSREVSVGAQVVYSIETIAQAVAGPLCIVGYGNAAKAAVKACVAAGCEGLCITGTADKKRAFSFSGAAEVVSLGETFDERLFYNEFAIITAAHTCGAGALLLVDEQAAQSNLLAMLAAQEGLALFKPLEGDKVFQLWVSHDFDSTQPSWNVKWRKCPVCKLNHDERTVLEDHGTCPTCGGMYRLTSDERIAETFDAGSFEEWDAGIPETNPLEFPGYPDLLDRMTTNSGLEEAVRCGCARLAGMKVAFCVMESTFMMGSMGTVVGEKITRTIERATALGLPLIIFTASGGARMQEGLMSLMQMAKISAAIERHGKAGLLYVSVLTDPTTGGVTASFAMQGDVILAEPKALIGFAGQRVIQDTIRQTLPKGFQTAEFALKHGLIDAIVPRAELRGHLAHIVALHVATAKQRDAVVLHSYASVQEVLAGAKTVRTSVVKKSVVNEKAATPKGLFQTLSQAVSKTFDKTLEVVTGGAQTEDASMKRALRKRGIADAPAVFPVTEKEGEGQGENRAWESVLLARNVHRPTAQYYIDNLVEGFIELHGDRMFADDGAILAGIGWIEGQPVTVIAEEKGANLEQRIARNFGCPQPEGYRKSLRLMKQAEKFGRPIVCFVDTQGAFCGMEAEERGQGNAIADNLVAMAGLTVPVVCVVLGEGGSGGALALAVGNKVAMQEHAVYSVLSPEGFASILWKDRSRAAEAAAVMKMSAAEACEMGIIEEVLYEGPVASHETPEVALVEVRRFVVDSLRELDRLSVEELLNQRYERFRAF